MRFEEALVELGISSEATADEARRAYLRLLKERKPETHPVEFRRLREAYEIVRAMLASAKGARVPAPNEARVPRIIVKFDSPKLATPAETPASARPASRVVDVDALVESGQLEEAARQLMRAYRTSATDADAWRPAPHVTLDLVLRLHAKSSLEAATRLERRFRKHMRTSGETLDARLAARWALARELGAVPAELSPAVRAALADFARTTDAAACRAKILVLREANARKLPMDAFLLRKHARTFARAFAASLDPPMTASVRIGITLTVLAAGAIVFALIFSALGSHVDSPEARARRDAMTAVDAFARAAGAHDEATIASRAALLWSDLDKDNCDGAREQIDELQRDLASAPRGLRPIMVDALRKSQIACNLRVDMGPLVAEPDSGDDQGDEP